MHKNDLRRYHIECLNAFSWYVGLDKIRQGVVCEMCFNLGLARLKGFKKMLTAVETGCLMRWIGVCCIPAGIVALCFLSYRLGMSNAKIQVIEKQVEVIKYVEKEQAKIHSKPAADQIELLNRMRASQL